MPGAHRWCVSGSCARSGLPGIAAAAGASTGGLHLISTSPAARRGVPSSTLPARCLACRPPARALVIPASTIDRILPPLVQTGRVARGWLGAALYPVALSDAVSQQIGQDRGLMVLRVADGGPAAAAGIIAGDILVAIGGTVVGRPSRIAQSFGPESIGQQLELSLLRAGTRLTLNATIAARPSR